MDRNLFATYLWPIVGLIAAALLAGSGCSFDTAHLDQLRAAPDAGADDTGPTDVTGDVSPVDATDTRQDPGDAREDTGDIGGDTVQDSASDTPPEDVPDTSEDPPGDVPSGDCGNGDVNAGETCDTAGESATCDDDCTAVDCGDGNINQAAGEVCDDGDDTGGDGCSASCQIEEHWDCTGDAFSTCYECGDGSLDPTEECDDGDTDDSDGCAGDCTIELHFNCTQEEGETSQCFECGDGVVDGPVDDFPGEACDDGDTDDCTPPCPGDCGVGASGDVFANTCGDGVRRCGELCDDDDLADLACSSFGFSEGTLDCATNCTFDLGDCDCGPSDTDTDDDDTCDLLDDDDDGDGCDDAVDSDPLVAPAIPYASLDILFVALDQAEDADFQLSDSDAALILLLEDAGHFVTLFEEDAGGCNGDTDGASYYEDAIDPDDNGVIDFDVMWVSASCDQLHVVDDDAGGGNDPDPSWVASLEIPVITNHYDLFDNLFFATDDRLGTSDKDELIIDDNTHFVTELVTTTGDKLVVYDNPETGGADNGTMGWVNVDNPDADLADGLVSLASMEDNANHALLFYVEDGGSLIEGETAAERRLGIGLVEGDLLTDLGGALVLRAVLWAAGETSVDPVIDGDGVPAHCDVCPSLYDPDQTDVDGDGLGPDCECDDAVPTCTDDCTANADADEEASHVDLRNDEGFITPDCYEVYCGSDPGQGYGETGDIADDCYWADGDLRTLDAAIEAAKDDEDEHERILVTYDPFSGDKTVDCVSGGYTMRFSVPITFDSQNHGFQVEGPGCTYEGVEASSTGDRVFEIHPSAENTTIRGFRITDCKRAAIQVQASYATLENLLIDCGESSGNDRAGVLVGWDTEDPILGTRIVGNVFLGHPDDGIQLEENSDDTTIDNNTFVGPMFRGIFVRNPCDDLCIRNNLFTDLSNAIRIASTSSWAEDCDDGLSDLTWNNALFKVASPCYGGCQTANPAGTNYIPADQELFFDYSGSYGVNPGFDANYCLSAPALIDAAADLGYDRNGDDPGLYNDDGPDIGGLESGSGFCAE
jgi:cysteine-rich repeat protein